MITFLTLPLVILILALILALGAHQFGWPNFHEQIKDYKFLSGFYQSVSALIFGLAGLNSFDRYSEAKMIGTKNERH